MIRAIVFDFGQTLVDSADGFRTAEKEAQRKSCAALRLTAGEEFLKVYAVREAPHGGPFRPENQLLMVAAVGAA